VPTTWNVQEIRDGERVTSANFRSYDPGQATFERIQQPGRPVVPPAELRIDVRYLVNNLRQTAKQAADEFANAPDPARSELKPVCRRDDVIIAGQPATLSVEQTTDPANPPQLVRVYFAVSATRDRLFVIYAWPSDTARAAELDRFTSTFTTR